MVSSQIYGGMTWHTPTRTPVSVLLTMAPYGSSPTVALRAAVVQVPPACLRHYFPPRRLRVRAALRAIWERCTWKRPALEILAALLLLKPLRRNAL